MNIKTTIGTGVVALSLLFGGVAHAEDSEVQVEAWDDAVTVYGQYLETDEENREVTNELLGYEETDEIGYVGAVDTYEYIGLNSTDESLKSSIRIMRTPEGTGLDLEINDEGGNITKVTEEMYRNALMTSGFHDAEVQIASFMDVTGESALSGVFKAQEIKGEEVDTERTELAQEELNTVVDINEENEGNDGYSQEQLNKAIAEMKAKVSEEDGELTEDRVREIVQETLEENALTDYISPDHVDRIVVVIVQGQDMGLFSGESANQFIESGKNLVDDITSSDEFQNAKDRASELGNDIADTVTSDGFMDSVLNFFERVWNWVTGLFSGDSATD